MLNFSDNYLIKTWRGQDSLRQRFLSSVINVFLEKIIIKGVQFVRTIIVARILFPHDIGLFGLASLAMTVTEVFTQTGFNSAIIQKEEKEAKRYIDNAWTVNVIRGIVLSFVLFFFVAPLAGRFFDNSSIVPFAQALSLYFLISGFDNIGLVFFQKELRFVRLFTFNVICFTTQAAVVAISAIILQNAWAMVVGLVAFRLVSLILSYVVHPYRPKLNFDFTGARRLFRFGRWITVSSIFGFLISQGDTATIGKLLDPSTLGFYQIAFALGMLPAVEVARSLNSILFPLYSQLQGDLARLKENFLKVSRPIFALAIPASIGLLALAPEVVHFVYGERWLPLVPILYVLIFLGLARSFEYIINPIFLGIGRPNIQTYVLITQAVVMYALIVPLTNTFGPVGTAIAVLCGAFSVQLVYIFRLRSEINIGLKNWLSLVGIPLLAGALMGGFLWKMKQQILISNFAWLIGYVVFGIVVYVLIFILLDRFIGQSKFKKSILELKNLSGI